MPWEHLVTRRISVQITIAWNFGFGELMEDAYGAGIRDTAVYYDGEKTEYFVDATQHKAFNERLDGLLSDPAAVENLIPDAKRFVEEKYAFIERLLRGAGTLSNTEIAALYGRLARHHAEYYTRMWMVFRIGEAIALELERLLAQRVGVSHAKELVLAFSTPLEPNDAVKERLEFAKIPQGRMDLMERHVQKYRHIPMYDFDHEPFTAEHFMRGWEKREDRDAPAEGAFGQRKAQFDKRLSELNPDPKLRTLILMQKDAVFLRDYRDTIRQKLNLVLRDFYAELGKRIGLSVKEIALLTNDEIASHVLSGTRFSQEEIARRQQAFLLVQRGSGIEIFSGERARAKADEMLGSEEVKATEARGSRGSPGIARGPARIVHTNADLHKVRAGDVLIAHMTRQDFVPYLRNAAAIVTDEGGVACHAAIVAREFGIPCVVGTRNATRVFQDGEALEVDANEGVVRRAVKKRRGSATHMNSRS
jgi:phosphoenolpyruvate synthase/pyruvate phosphate dikinase